MNKLLHIYDTTGNKESIDSLLKVPQCKTWNASLSHELGRLSQGINGIQVNDVVDFIPRSEVPSDRIVTYANMICNDRPHKI